MKRAPSNISLRKKFPVSAIKYWQNTAYGAIYDMLSRIRWNLLPIVFRVFSNEKVTYKLVNSELAIRGRPRGTFMIWSWCPATATETIKEASSLIPNACNLWMTNEYRHKSHSHFSSRRWRQEGWTSGLNVIRSKRCSDNNFISTLSAFRKQLSIWLNWIWISSGLPLTIKLNSNGDSGRAVHELSWETVLFHGLMPKN